MIAAALLAFREGLEAALILGIGVSVLRRVGRKDQEKMVWLGAGLAALASLAAGIGLYSLGISLRETLVRFAGFVAHRENDLPGGVLPGLTQRP